MDWLGPVVSFLSGLGLGLVIGRLGEREQIPARPKWRHGGGFPREQDE